MNSKGHFIGSTTVLFVSTILIVIILVVFALGSAVLRKIDRSDEGIKVYSISEIGLGDLVDYLSDYSSVVGFRVNKKVVEGFSWRLSEYEK